MKKLLVLVALAGLSVPLFAQEKSSADKDTVQKKSSYTSLEYNKAILKQRISQD